MARNGEGLYLRQGIWCFRYRDEQTGKWREKSTGKTKKRDAWREKEQFLEQLRNGTLPTNIAAWTLKQAADHWLDSRKITAAPKTASVERRLLRQVLKVFGDDRVLRSLTPHDIEGYQVRRRKTVGPRTVNLELFCLRQILKRGGLWSRFREHYHPLRVPKAKIGKVLTDEQAKHLIEKANSRPDWEAAFLCAVLAHSTGCRGCEIKALRLKDVDLTDASPSLMIQTSKTDAGIREIPLNSTARWAATKLVQRAQRLGASAPDHYLLPINRSKHTRSDDPRRGKSKGYDFTDHQRSWAKAWCGLRKAAGVTGFRFHDMRTSFITAGAEANVPMEVMMALVGHMAPEMTRHYTMVRTKAQEKAVTAIEAEHKSLFGGLAIQDQTPFGSVQ